MRDLIRRTISIIREKVNNNLEAIRQNQLKIREMSKGGVDGQLNSDFEKHSELNRLLTAENNDLLKVQNILVDFYEKYKNTVILNDDEPIVDIYSIADQDEIFELTVKEIIKFDDKHPYFNDRNFYDRLIEHYTYREEYEKCDELKNRLK